MNELISEAEKTNSTNFFFNSVSVQFHDLLNDLQDYLKFINYGIQISRDKTI